MTQWSDDEVLVGFLKEYRPFPPPANHALENQIMEQISFQSTSKLFNFNLKSIGVATAIMASLTVVWGLGRIHHPLSKIAASPEELEAFMVESWYGSMGDTDTDSYPYRPITADWLLLENSD